jgi:hypothetical protein
MPQGPRKPTVVEMSWPMRIGKVSILAALIAPPLAPGAFFALLKSKVTKGLRTSTESSSGDSPFVVRRRWKRLIDVGAEKRSLKRLVLLGTAAAGAARGVAVDLGLKMVLEIDAGATRLIEGSSRFPGRA